MSLRNCTRARNRSAVLIVAKMLFHPIRDVVLTRARLHTCLHEGRLYTGMRALQRRSLIARVQLRQRHTVSLTSIGQHGLIRDVEKSVRAIALVLLYHKTMI